MRLDPGGADHRAPALGVFLHERRHLRRRVADRVGGEIDKAFLHLGELQHLGDGGGDLLGDRHRRPRRRHDAEPGDRLESRENLGKCRHVGKRRDAPLAAHRKQLQLAAYDVLSRHAEIVEHHLHLPGEQVGKRGRAPLVGNVREAHASHRFRSEEHTSELQSRLHLVCRLLLEKKNNDDPEFVKLAEAHGARLVDVRKPRPIRESKQFSDLARKLPCLRIPVLGTDGAIEKRTTALLLTDALNEKGIPATFVATGQTGLMQGSAYGVPLDSIKGDFMVGELEAEIVRAYEETKPKVIIVEGQGSISHPAYVCGTRAIINASMPSGILMMHAPARKTRSFRREVVSWPMPTVDEEIEWLQFFTRIAGKGQVLGLGINHENMTWDEVEETVRTYETKYRLPTADPLWHGCGKFVDRIQRMT